jgi:hypothetical protein
MQDAPLRRPSDAVRNPAQFRLGGAEFQPAYRGLVIV